MAWRVGIDEAGWGPNLGPFVMTAVALRVPDSGADLWETLSRAVCPSDRGDDERLVVADSKAVYSPDKGLTELERTVLATLGGSINSVADIIQKLAPGSVAELQSECWYTGTLALPAGEEPVDEDAGGGWFRAMSEADIELALIRSVLVCPARFNMITDREGTKAGVSTEAVRHLILECRRGAEAKGHDLHIDVDKQGGRNHYCELLQPAVDPGFIWAREEGALRSVYDVEGLPQRVRVTFTPRADEHCFCVALASMISKYLRELLMAEFNAYWQSQVPGLKATAGYPLDAKRFMDGIRPALLRLGQHEDMIWRKK